MRYEVRQVIHPKLPSNAYAHPPFLPVCLSLSYIAEKLLWLGIFLTESDLLSWKLVDFSTTFLGQILKEVTSLFHPAQKG